MNQFTDAGIGLCGPSGDSASSGLTGTAFFDSFYFLQGSRAEYRLVGDFRPVEFNLLAEADMKGVLVLE